MPEIMKNMETQICYT